MTQVNFKSFKIAIADCRFILNQVRTTFLRIPYFLKEVHESAFQLEEALSRGSKKLRHKMQISISVFCDFVKHCFQKAIKNSNILRTLITLNFHCHSQGCVWLIMNLDLIAVPLVIRIQMEARIWDYFKFRKSGGVSGTKFQLFPVM